MSVQISILLNGVMNMRKDEGERGINSQLQVCWPRIYNPMQNALDRYMLHGERIIVCF